MVNSTESLLKEIFSLRQFPKKMSLENISALCTSLGHPQNRYPTIHLAGTNGKGSTAYLIYKILMAHGLKTGLYTSPHLKKFNERVRIDDHFIPDTYLIVSWQRLKSLVTQINASFFDTTTAMAFEYFADNNVDIAVIETGMGGRLDATNIVKPAAAVITPIDFDHIKYLGNDILSIAKEKAAIIKKGVITFSAKQEETVRNLLKTYGRIYEAADTVDLLNAHINKLNSSFSLLDKKRNIVLNNLRFSLAGKHQLDNLVLAYQVSRWYLEQNDISFNEKIFRNTLKNSHWPGRLEKISTSPNIIVDVCHNPGGFRSIAEHIRTTFEHEKIHLLIALIDDKSYREILEIISPLFSSITITEPIHDYPIPGEILQAELAQMNKQSFIIKDLNKAFEFVKMGLAENETLFVLGSHYLIGNLGNY